MHTCEPYIKKNMTSFQYFSSAVFKENVKVLSQPCRSQWWRCHHAKTSTFSNISIITEDIYLKLRLVVYYERGTHTSRANTLTFFSSPEPKAPGELIHVV